MRLVLTQSLIIAAKDTRMFLKDRFGLGFALLFPLIFVLGFSLALRDIGPATSGSRSPSPPRRGQG